MLLPNAERVLIDTGKLVDYLLNPSHADNGGKAAFFIAWGFSPTRPEVLDGALRDMIARTEVAQQVKGAWGIKYVVQGALDSPRGRTPIVRTIRIVDAAHDAPRLVTAYPC